MNLVERLRAVRKISIGTNVVVLDEAADRIEALEDVIQLTIDDLLIRGEVGRKGERVVNLSASVWDRLNDAVENKEALNKGKDQ